MSTALPDDIILTGREILAIKAAVAEYVEYQQSLTWQKIVDTLGPLSASVKKANDGIYVAASVEPLLHQNHIRRCAVNINQSQAKIRKQIQFHRRLLLIHNS